MNKKIFKSVLSYLDFSEYIENLVEEFYCELDMAVGEKEIKKLLTELILYCFFISSNIDKLDFESKED